MAGGVSGGNELPRTHVRRLTGLCVWKHDAKFTSRKCGFSKLVTSETEGWPRGSHISSSNEGGGELRSLRRMMLSLNADTVVLLTVSLQTNVFLLCTGPSVVHEQMANDNITGS